MGQLRTAPYDVADGQEYAAYLANMVEECGRLASVGRLPDTDEMAGFLATARQVLAQVSSDVSRVQATGDSTIVSSIQMTAPEYSRMRNMNDTFRNLLEILEMRQALELNRTPGAGRVAESIQSGAFTE